MVFMSLSIDLLLLSLYTNGMGWVLRLYAEMLSRGSCSLSLSEDMAIPDQSFSWRWSLNIFRKAEGMGMNHSLNTQYEFIIHLSIIH